jgi:hypothetical protein
MRYKYLAFIGASVDAYVPPFMYALLQSKLYARTHEAGVCVSWSNLVVCIGQ